MMFIRWLSSQTCMLQADVIPVCRELGIAIVCYSPLGRGFLTGKRALLHHI